MGAAVPESGSLKPWRRRILPILPYLVVLVLLLVLPFAMDAYYLSMLAKVLIFAIFAMSLDLILGYAGLLSLGHAVFLGVAGYTTGILMVRYGLENGWLLTSLSLLSAGTAALVVGFLALRMSGIYFLLITVAFGELFKSAAVKWTAMTGGTNGLIGIGRPSIGIHDFNWPGPSFYFFILFCFLAAFFLLYRVTRSAFGKALVGIRENEARMQSLGFNTWAHKYVAFVLSGLFAGFSGVLFAFFYGMMVPEHFGLSTSASVMLMVVIGSPGTLVGPVIGAAVVVLLEHFSSIYTPERWPLVLGGIFVISVMFLRGGIGTGLGALWRAIVNHHGDFEGRGSV